MKLRTCKTFYAAHHLPNYDGPCQNVHGHSWKVEIEVTGKVDEKTGFVVDFKDLKSTFMKYDHRDLNDFFENPTAENIVSKITEDIRKEYSCGSILVRVWESEDSYAQDYFLDLKDN